MMDPPFPAVPRRIRFDGWTPARQWSFIQALEATASVAEAARRVGMTTGSAYRLRRHPEAEGFRRAWAATQARIWQRVEAVALDRVVNGDVETIERDGMTVAIRRRPCSDRLMIHMLQEQVRRLEAEAARLAAANADAAAAAAAARWKENAPPPAAPITAEQAETRGLHALHALVDALPDATGWDFMPHQLGVALDGPAPRLPHPEKTLAPASIRIDTRAGSPRLRPPAAARKVTNPPPGRDFSIATGFVPRPYDPDPGIGGGALAGHTGSG